MDWIGSFFILSSLIVIGMKKSWGWLLGILGGVSYLYIAIISNLYGMIFMEIVLIGISIYNYIKWKFKKQ